MYGKLDTNSETTTTVVLVDDDPLSRTLFSRVIERAGWSVVTAGGVAEAEALLLEREVNLLLSDYRMPEPGDGEHLLRQTKRNYPSLPVCMMSSYWSTEDKRKMMEVGAIACISKPFNTETFISLMKKINRNSTAANSMR